MAELKPCPFCSADGDELGICGDADLSNNPARRIQCYSCGIEAPFYPDEAEAIAAWNRRPEEARTSAPVALEDRSVSSDVLDDCEAFEKAMVEAGYHSPDLGRHPGMYRYQRDQDRYLGWKLARAAAPVAWVRFRSDGGYEGPIMDSDPRMDGARRAPGGWTPLFAAAPVVPAGYALVPVEPTEEMIEAAFVGKVEAQCVLHQKRIRENMARDYRAIIAAAPQPPAPEAQGGVVRDAERCDVGHAHFTPFYLLANARRICAREYARKPNWVLATELFAVGSNSARRICREAGIDPDGLTVSRAAIDTAMGAKDE